MKIIVLMGQRKCSYPGEYAPEALACMTEAHHSDNPDYLFDEKKEYTDTNEFDAIELVTLDVSTEAIIEILSPKNVCIEAAVDT